MANTKYAPQWSLAIFSLDIYYHIKDILHITYICIYVLYLLEHSSAGSISKYMLDRDLALWKEHKKDSLYLVLEGKKGRKAEYVQRRVRFVNVQVPCPHSIIYVKFCTSRLCMKMSSFLLVRACAMPRMLYFSCGIPFPV